MSVQNFVPAEGGSVADEKEAAGQIDLQFVLQVAQVFVQAVVCVHQFLLNGNQIVETKDKVQLNGVAIDAATDSSVPVAEKEM